MIHLVMYFLMFVLPVLIAFGVIYYFVAFFWMIPVWIGEFLGGALKWILLGGAFTWGVWYVKKLFDRWEGKGDGYGRNQGRHDGKGT